MHDRTRRLPGHGSHRFAGLALAALGAWLLGQLLAPSAATAVAPRKALVSAATGQSIGALDWPANQAPLTATFVGDSVGGRGSLASSLAATWQARVRARVATFGPVGPNGTYAITHDAYGNTTAASISNLTVASQLTTVGLGTNDMRDGVTYGSFYATYAHLLDQVRLVSPTTALVCLGVWAAPSDKQAHFDALIDEQCAKHRGIFVPLADLFAYGPNRLPVGQPAFGGYHTDGFHPDDDGQAAISRRVLIALRLQ